MPQPPSTDRPSGSPARGGSTLISPASAAGETSPKSIASSSAASSSGVWSSLAASTDALREEKGMLKQQLRAFDVEFKLKHGRVVSGRLSLVSLVSLFRIALPSPLSLLSPSL